MSYGNESLDELERFLNTKPQTYAVAIGVRAAERAFPLLVHTDVPDAEAQEMVFLAARALLVASAFGLDTSSESRRAAVEATVEATNKLGDARGEPVFVVENVSEAIGCAAVLPVAPPIWQPNMRLMAPCSPLKRSAMRVFGDRKSTVMRN